MKSRCTARQVQKAATQGDSLSPIRASFQAMPLMPPLCLSRMEVHWPSSARFRV
jgi:hypothetical protein